MKYTIAIIIIALFASCNSKNSNARSQDKVGAETNLPLYPYGEPLFKWESVEKQNDPLKEKFVKLAPKVFFNEYNSYHQYSASTKTQAEFKKEIHVLDFNGDGLDDIVYEGKSGGEPQEVAFILNTGDGFKVVFRETQRINKLDFINHKLTNAYFEDWGCCEDYIDFYKIYHLEYNGADPVFKNTYTTASINSTYYPKKFLKKPIYFLILNDNYKMRLAPIIDDTTVKDNKIPEMTIIGNTIDTLNKGTKGRAVAAQSDKTGRVWWLVEVDRDYSAYGFFFYEQEANTFYKESADTTHRAAKMGWISSRYVKKISQ